MQPSPIHVPVVIQYYLCNIVNGKTVCGVQEITLLGIGGSDNNVIKCYDINISVLNNNCLHHGEHSNVSRSSLSL